MAECAWKNTVTARLLRTGAPWCRPERWKGWVRVAGGAARVNWDGRVEEAGGCGWQVERNAKTQEHSTRDRWLKRKNELSVRCRFVTVVPAIIIHNAIASARRPTLVLESCVHTLHYILNLYTNFYITCYCYHQTGCYQYSYEPFNWNKWLFPQTDNDDDNYDFSIHDSDYNRVIKK